VYTRDHDVRTDAQQAALDAEVAAAVEKALSHRAGITAPRSAAGGPARLRL